MLYALVCIMVIYLVPLLVATGADPYGRYCDGCFVGLSKDIAGPWLSYWITIAAAFSCIGQFLAEMGKEEDNVVSVWWWNVCIFCSLC
jgi:hypothetical protein